MDTSALILAGSDPLIPAGYDVGWTIVMVAFAGGTVVALIALIRAYLRSRERDRDVEQLKNDMRDLRERDED